MCDGVSCKTKSGKKLNFKGEIPKSGSIIINRDSEDEAEYIQIGEYCAYGTKEAMQVWKGKCTLRAGLYDDNMKLVALYSDLQKKYDLDVTVNYAADYDKSENAKKYNEKHDTNSLYYVLNNSGDSLKKSTTFVVPEEGLGDFSLAKCSQIKNVIIHDGITRIGAGALKETSIENVVVPDSVTEIGDDAFRECPNLKEVKLPNNIVELNRGLFYGCKKLESINIPKTVSKISRYVFALSGIKKVDLPESLTIIDEYTFYQSKIEEIKIPNKVNKISFAAFTDCSKLTKIVLPESLEIIENKAFDRCYKLENFDMPSNVKSIGTFAFYGSKITSIKLGDKLTSIADGAFEYINLKEVYIPKNVSKIEQNAFGNNKSLTKITVDPQNKYYYDGGVNAIIEKKSKKIQTGTSEIIPDGVLEIGEEAYQSSELIKSIIIPDSVKKIGKNAFFDCDNLKYLELGKGVTEIGTSAFNSSQIQNDIIIPSATTRIGARAFYDNYISKITFEDSVNWYTYDPKTTFSETLNTASKQSIILDDPYQNKDYLLKTYRNKIFKKEV